MPFNSLPNYKNLDRSKLKLSFADNKINAAEKLKSVLRHVENIVKKGENAGFHNVFKTASYKGWLKVVIACQIVKSVKNLNMTIFHRVAT